jgi:tRNA-specific 2-thiouridylase
MPKAKALVLFSGGLDSLLTARHLQEQGITVQAVHFSSPFYSSEAARKGARMLGIRLHERRVGPGYFRMVENPPHGRGSNMNPCIDCKAYMLRAAERLRRRLGMDFLATGEVVGERPLSQTRPALRQIERSAGLGGKIVRPLSGRLLPATAAEEKSMIKRESMLDISGRSRKPQMALARRYGIRDYPAPAGGCLLTDPEYSRRLREHLKSEGSITWKGGELLKLGRHFRLGKAKIVVGRNEKENSALMGLARGMRLARLEVAGIPGPLTVVSGRPSARVLDAAARLTVRYSDAPDGRPAGVEVRSGRSRRYVMARAMPKKEVAGLMV